MSGPKTSHYTLTPEQRRILEEQRKIKIERELLVRQQHNTKSIIVEADRIIEQSEPLYAEIGSDTGSLIQVKKMRETAMNAFNQASSAGDNDGSAHLQELNQTLHRATRKLAEITKALAAEHASADKAFRTELAGRIDDGFGFDFTFDTIGDASIISRSSFTKKIQSKLDDITSLMLTDEQKAKAETIQAKLSEIDDPDFLKSFYAMTVVPFTKECQTYHDAYASYGEEYERKCYIYETSAQKLGIIAEHIPFSSDAITILDAKLKETEEVIRHQEEQAYISHCVDETMREMGYAVVGNREMVRRNGKRFRNELYLFDEGTAVNITYSSDGQITMELGGISTDDRIPTETESASLASDMRTFCDDYYEIERRLRKKGIVTTQISILPPDAQYAQIINVSDYNLSAEVSVYEAKAAKKRTASSNTQQVGE